MPDHDRLCKELISAFFLEILDLFVPDVRAYVAAGSVDLLDKEIFVDVTSPFPVFRPPSRQVQSACLSDRGLFIRLTAKTSSRCVPGGIPKQGSDGI